MRRIRTWSGAGRWAFVNHFYFYLWDPDWGGAFWKTNAYAPWPVWIWLNGHTWAQRQCERLGIGYTALDNGFRDCEDPAALQRICDRLGSGRGEELLLALAAAAALAADPRRICAPATSTSWRFASSRSPTPGCSTDRRPGGRSSNSSSATTSTWADRRSVSLIFDRRISRRTPGTWRTQVITKGVDPQISCYYQSSRIKQYFKEHRALRTETVICDTRDFGIGRRVTAENWKALRAVGEHANQRLCDAQAADARPAPDVATFTQVTRPSQIDGQHAPALPFGDPRVMAVLAAIVGFTHLLAGFDNPALVRAVTTLLGCPYTSRQATYDLRRLKRKGLIVRLPGHHRYQLTPLGRRVAVLFTKVYGRVLAPGLAELDPRLPTDLANRSELAHAWRQLDRRLNQFTNAALTAA